MSNSNSVEDSNDKVEGNQQANGRETTSQESDRETTKYKVEKIHKPKTKTVEKSPSQPEEPLRGSLEFAQNDYELVHKEIMDIKSCRTNIFMGTLGVIGAVGIAILGIFGTLEATSWRRWLPFAAAIPVGLLTCAILATIHKARGINIRAGYMEALAEYLINDEVPLHFGGWAKAKFILDRCKIFFSGSMMLDELPKCPEDEEKLSCTVVAKKLARDIVKNIRWRPDLLHSFTSLSTYIYSLAYLLSIGSLLLAIMATIRNYRTEAFDIGTYLIAIVAGVVLAGIFSVALVVSKYFAEKRGKETKLQKWFRRCLCFAGVIVPAIFLVLMYAKNKGISDSGTVMVAYGLGCVISAIAVFAACTSYSKVDSLRRGKYSTERWYRVWRICFKRCPLMAKKTPTD